MSNYEKESLVSKHPFIFTAEVLDFLSELRTGRKQRGQEFYYHTTESPIQIIKTRQTVLEKIYYGLKYVVNE